MTSRQLRKVQDKHSAFFFNQPEIYGNGIQEDSDKKLCLAIYHDKSMTEETKLSIVKLIGEDVPIMWIVSTPIHPEKV